MVRPCDLACRCMGFEPPELFELWRRRAAPTVRRLVARGRPVNQARVAQVLELMVGIERGAQGAMGVENWVASHHLPTCPFSGRMNPLATVDPSEEARWANR